MSQLNKNFAAYLQQNYKDAIEEAIRSYIVDEELMGCFDVEHLRTLDYLNIDFDLIDIFFEDTNNASLCFSAVAHCYYSFHVYSHDECIHFQDDNVERWLKIFLTSSIGVRLYDLNTYCVEIYSKETYILEQNTGELIPYIFEEDLERIAESFLIKYCPMALTEPMALPIEDIAENMGLEIFCLEMSGDIFGELFFENIGYDRCIGEDISRGTLLLNQRYVKERSDGAKKFTIAHECVHWARHRKYMDLNRILHQDVSSSIECPTSSKGWHQLQKKRFEIWNGKQIILRQEF